LALRPIIVALAVALLAAPAASASTTTLDHGKLTYTAAAGEANDVKVSVQSGYYVIEDAGAASFGAVVLPCGLYQARLVYCPQSKVTSVAIDLGDGDDSLVVEGALAVEVACGTGVDAVAAGSGGVLAADCQPAPLAAEPPVELPLPPAAPTVEPPAVPVGPAVTIASAPVKVDARGRVPVAVTCPESAPGGCAGRVTLALPLAPGTLAKAASAAPVLGRSKRFKLSAGQTRVVPVRLDRRASRIIKRRRGGRRRVKLAVTVEVTTTAGTQAATGTITVKLRRP
jgi:hypothetical protein